MSKSSTDEINFIFSLVDFQIIFKINYVKKSNLNFIYDHKNSPLTFEKSKSFRSIDGDGRIFSGPFNE